MILTIRFITIFISKSIELIGVNAIFNENEKLDTIVVYQNSGYIISTIATRRLYAR